MAINYGSCPRGCGAQVAFMHDDADVPLDPNEFTPHVCETPWRPGAPPAGPRQSVNEPKQLEGEATYRGVFGGIEPPPGPGTYALDHAPLQQQMDRMMGALEQQHQ